MDVETAAKMASAIANTTPPKNSRNCFISEVGLLESTDSAK
jgi:hypothetical protein